MLVKPNSYLLCLINDCQYLLFEMPNVKVSFVYRSANMSAHTLAKAACSMSDRLVWHVSPSPLSSVLHADVF